MSQQKVLSSSDEAALVDLQGIFSLDGKVALVTGGSRGLGFHAASGLLQAGCSQVFITSRHPSDCDKAVAGLNALPNKYSHARAIAVPTDCSRTDELDRLVSVVSQSTDHVDIVFANAGTVWMRPLEEHSEKEFSEVMDLNVKGTFLLVQKFLPLLSAKATREDPSRIIINSSIAGVIAGGTGHLAMPSYGASKAALIQMAKYLAIELGPRNILTNVIAPGFYPTKMSTVLSDKVGGPDVMATMIPNRRAGTPNDIASLVVFLSSKAGSYVNGATMVTDGGFSLLHSVNAGDTSQNGVSLGY